MANEKKPSIYSDRGSIGSSEELDEYGVWVKNEPQVIDGTDNQITDDFSPVFDGVANEPADFDDFDFPADSGDDFVSGELPADDFASEEISFEDTSSDNFPDDDFEVPTVKSIENSSIESKLDSIQDDFDSAVGKQGDLSTQLLLKIANELASIRGELCDLKKEFSVARTTSADEEEDETIALTGDELDNILNTSDEQAEIADETEALVPSGGMIPSEDDEDETIALTGDELDNILNSADFTEEAGTGEAEADELDTDMSFDESMGIEDMEFTEESEPDSSLSGIEFEDISNVDEIGISEDIEIPDNIDISEDLDMGDEDIDISEDMDISDTDVFDPSEDLEVPENIDISSESGFSDDFDIDDTAGEDIDISEEAAVEEAVVEDAAEEEPDYIDIDFDDLGIDLNPENLLKETETPQEEETTASEDEIQEDDIETLDNFGLDIDTENVSLDDDDIAVSIDEEKEPEELERLREEGATPVTFPPENASYLEDDDADIDLTDAVIEEPELSAEYIDEPPQTDPEIDMDSIELSDDIEDFDITSEDEDTEGDEDSQAFADLDIDIDTPMDDTPEEEAASAAADADDITGDTIEEPVDSDDSFDDIDIAMDEDPVSFEPAEDNEEIDSLDDDLILPDGNDDEMPIEDQVIPENFEAELEETPVPFEADPEEDIPEDMDIDLDDLDEEKIIEDEPEKPVEAGEMEEEADIVPPPVQQQPAQQIAPSQPAPVQMAPSQLSAPQKDKDGFELPSDLRSELRNILTYMDQLLESLPEEKIEEFAKSEYFDSYKKLFKELGLV